MLLTSPLINFRTQIHTDPSNCQSGKRLRGVGEQRKTEEKEAPRASAHQNRGGLPLLSNPTETLAAQAIKRPQFLITAVSFGVILVLPLRLLSFRFCTSL